MTAALRKIKARLIDRGSENKRGNWAGMDISGWNMDPFEQDCSELQSRHLLFVREFEIRM